MKLAAENKKIAEINILAIKSSKLDIIIYLTMYPASYNKIHFNFTIGVLQLGFFSITLRIIGTINKIIKSLMM